MIKKFIFSLIAFFSGLLLLAAPLCAQEDFDPDEFAAKFLIRKGVTYAKPVCIYQTKTLAVYSDSPNKAFVVLADKKYKSKLGNNLVLAYSTETALNGGVDTRVYDIINNYDAQLASLDPRVTIFNRGRNRRILETAEKTRGERVIPYTAPMLQNIGQGAPYNKYFPIEAGGNNAVAGCGSLALAQVLYFYGYPTSGHGQGTITVNNNKWDYSLDQFHFSFDGSEDDIARVVVASAASMNARAIGPNDTQTAANDFKGVLISKWGYSVECTHVRDCDEPTMASLLFKELREGRPVIVAQTGDHTFTCDGRDGPYLHINFGWSGYCNGWYRYVPYDCPGQRLPFKEMIIGIKPADPSESQTGVVSLAEPGTLEEVLGDSIWKIQKIALSGPINGDDIVTLRRMAGAVSDYKETHGALSEMDLSDVTIVGGLPYHTRPCYNMGISGQYIENGVAVPYKYDMSKITDADWQNILAHGLERSSSRLLSKGADGKYYVTFFAENNIMGKYMFEGCENLTKVILPTSIVELRSYVFLDCRALESVENIPAKCDPNALKGSGMEKK